MIHDGIRLEDGIDSFLMIGQSNMAGRGEFGDVEDIENPDCYMLRNGRWQPMAEPINPDRDIFKILYHSGRSLAASFADCYAKHNGRRVGLIPCADGGTHISEWEKGEVLFDNAVMVSHLAKRSSDLKGIIWHQGESDCSAGLIGEYPNKFVEFVSDIRSALGNPDLPFVAGELSYNLNPDWHAEKFNKMLHCLEGEISNFAVVSAEGLRLKNDGLHFNAESLREFGIRYFEAMNKIL